MVSNVHGHGPDPTYNVDIGNVHEDLVAIEGLTGPTDALR